MLLEAGRVKTNQRNYTFPQFFFQLLSDVKAKLKQKKKQLQLYHTPDHTNVLYNYQKSILEKNDDIYLG